MPHRHRGEENADELALRIVPEVLGEHPLQDRRLTSNDEQFCM